MRATNTTVKRAAIMKFFILLVLLMTKVFSFAWNPFPTRIPYASSSQLKMGKGFNKARNKQAQLAEKLNIAKQQEGKVEPKDEETMKTTKSNQPSHEDFQRLLDSTASAIPKDDDTDSAFIAEIKIGKKKNKVKKDPQAKIKAERALAEKKRKEQEAKKKQNAQRRYFEPLINVDTNQPLGSIEAAKLVPWVPPYLKDCLMVIADPRPNSADLRQSIQYLASAVEPKEEDAQSQRTIQDQVIFVTADSVKEIQAWLKRSKTESLIPVFSDPDLAWMNQYELLTAKTGATDNVWSMSMLTFDTNGNIVERSVGVIPSDVTQLVMETMEIMSEEAT